VGRNVSALMPETEAARHDSYMHRHLATRESAASSGGGARSKGGARTERRFPLHLSIGRSDTGAGPVFVAILHDLTQRHAVQAAEERSERLGAIGEMAGGIAHDFNNILTLVIGNLELATNREVTPEVRSLVGNALEAAELGADLTARLLAVARQSRLAPERDRRQRRRSTRGGARPAEPRSGHRIDLGLSPGAGEIEVDGPQLQAALLNLLRNAQDAMPDDGVILVTTERVEVDETYMAQEIDVAPGDYVRISVSDTGIGMSPRPGGARSSPSSPPSRRARAPVSASPRPTASCGSRAAT
jgi:signal transduction histidine kinase